MGYPERLLPHSHYSFISSHSLLQRGLVLVRHVESSEMPQIQNELLSTNLIKIQSDHLRDLSNNLLGVFQKEDSFYGIEKEYQASLCALWEEKTAGVMPQNGEFFRDTGRGYYFIPIDLLLDFKFSYQEHVYHFMVFHTPTRCNFWHISIRLLNEKDQEVSSLELNKKQKHRLWKTAKDFLLSDIVTIDPVPYNTLPPAAYSVLPSPH